MVNSDNGTELTSNAILTWQEERRVGWHYIAPGKARRHLAQLREPRNSIAQNIDQIARFSTPLKSFQHAAFFNEYARLVQELARLHDVNQLILDLNCRQLGP